MNELIAAFLLTFASAAPAQDLSRFLKKDGGGDVPEVHAQPVNERGSGQQAGAGRGGAGAPASSQYEIQQCSIEEKPVLVQAIEEARGTVKQELSSLNAGLAQKIEGLVTNRQVIFRCVDPSQNEGETKFENGKAVVFVKVRAGRGAMYTPGEKTFHELIHATDPQNQLLNSVENHMRGATPDPVYGCQYASYKNIHPQAKQQFLDYVKQNNLVIPEFPRASYACTSDEETCGVLRKFAYICNSGKPVNNEAAAAADKRVKITFCISMGMQSACQNPNCETQRQETERIMSAVQKARTPGDRAAAARALQRRKSFVIAMGRDILRVATNEDKLDDLATDLDSYWQKGKPYYTALYHAAIDENIYNKCTANPDSFKDAQ